MKHKIKYLLGLLLVSTVVYAAVKTEPNQMIFKDDVTFMDTVILDAQSASRVLTTNGSKLLASSSVTTTELGYLSGVTSGIQTQLNGKASIGGALTANRAVVTDGSGVLISSSTISDTEVGYLDNVTSSLCGINQSCTLTNKTLTAPVISTISNTGTLTLPTSTDTLMGRTTTDSISGKTFLDSLRMTELSSSPSSPSAGVKLLYAKTDGKVYTKDSAGLEKQVGSGSSASQVKWIVDPNGQDNANGWIAYADASGTSPVDGTGGSPTVTAGYTNVSGFTYDQDKSLACSKGSGNLQGQGCSTAFKIPAGMAQTSTKITAEINYMTYSAAGTYASNDVSIWVYNVDSGIMQACNDAVGNGLLAGTANPGLSGASLWNKFRCTWYTNGDGDDDDYRLIYHIASTNADAYAIYHTIPTFTDATSIQSPIITPWVSYTPTGSWNTNTTYVGKWRRVGDTAEYVVALRFAGAPSTGALTVNLASGHVIDSTKTSDSLSREELGTAEFYDSSGANTGHLQGKIIPNNTTSVFVIAMGDASGDSGYMEAVTPTAPVSWVSGDVISISFKVPIVGWSAGAAISTSETLDQTIRASYRYSSSGNGNTSFANGTPEIVDYNVKDLDTHNAVTTGASWKFTAPAPKTYLVTVSHAWTTNASLTSTDVSIHKNNSGTKTRRLTLGLTDVAMNGATTIQLNKGETIDIRVTANGGASYSPQGTLETYIDIVSLPDFSIFSQYNETNYQWVIMDTRAGFGSTNANIPYFTNTPVSETVGPALLTVSNSSTLGNSFTALRRCRVTMTYIFSHTSTGETGGISMNASGGTLTTPGGLATAGPTVKKAFTQSNGTSTPQISTTITTIMKQGDVLRANSNNPSNLGTASQWQVEVFAEPL